MKRLVGYALAIAAICGHASATNFQYVISLQENRNGTIRPMDTITITTSSDEARPIFHTTTLSYTAKAIRTPNGDTLEIPGTVTTGFSATVGPTMFDPATGSAESRITLDFTELSGITDIPFEGTTIQQPEVKVMVELDDDFRLTPGGVPIVIGKGSDGIEVLASLKTQ